jgi:uncharacterized protein (DUF302 family)
MYTSQRRAAKKRRLAVLIGLIAILTSIPSEFAMGTETAVAGLRILPTQHNVADTLSRLESIAKARGVTVFARIDFSGDATRSGLTMRPTGLVLFGSPKSGTPLIIATPTVAIDLPLKVLAWEDTEGHTWVAYNEPDYLQSRHHFPPELEKNIAAVGSLAAAAAGDGPI